MKVVKHKSWKSPFKNDVYQGLVSIFTYGKLQYILNNISVKQKSKALDFGCGFGYFLLSTSTYFEQAVGIDYNSTIGIQNNETNVFVPVDGWDEKYLRRNLLEIANEMLKKETPNSNIQLIEVKNYMTPFSEEEFNFISAIDVLEHIKNRDKALSEIKRVLKKDGDFFYSVPNSSGISFYVRKIAAFILGIKEDPATEDHKNYKWKEELELVRKHFEIVKVTGYPINFKFLSPSIIVQCRKLKP